MKKHSKTQKQKPVETIGIDLGDKMSHYCVVNQDGEVVEEGNFRNQVSSLEAHFSGEPRRIALEAGAQSAWISRELKGLGHDVIVANARELARAVSPRDSVYDCQSRSRRRSDNAL